MFAEGDTGTPQNRGSEAESMGATDGSVRRQYTLKGVEREAIDLMREAASVQGMKIGHWVSDRMKEAAYSALKDAERRKVTLEAVVGDITRGEKNPGSLPSSSDEQPEGSASRIARLELEVRELTRIQRDLLAWVVSGRS